MLFLRTVMLAVLAFALAIAPAAACTMGRQAAAADRWLSDASARMPHPDPARASRASDTPDSARDAARHAPSQDGPSASAGDDGGPGHRHGSKRPGGPSPCCALGCQAALPTMAGGGPPLEDTPSDRGRIGRADGPVDAHPLRIERPPRLGA
ncbi:hypothetical protein ASG51_13040 [Methylobacterium sp. Leaf465]|nr:hypothetical protein ASG51_13040 [Methylobacterium sp. Leaf465]